MRPLERSLEKLDDVRRKKLSEMISGSDDAAPGGTSTGLYIFLTGKKILLGREKAKEDSITNRDHNRLGCPIGFYA